MKRLRCNTDCQKLEEGSAERDQCEKLNCIEIAKSEDLGLDEYDYSYGYEDDAANEVIEVTPRSS